MFNKGIYNLLSYARNKKSLNIINQFAKIDNYNLIAPNLYLGNITGSLDKNFLETCKIEAIVNCTENEPYSEYFEDKLKFRLSINDSKNPENIQKFKDNIIDTINFIDSAIENDKPVFIHCYWGLMRSATVVACYLIKRYHIDSNEAISIIKMQRPMALVSFYNFNEILDFVEKNYLHK
jgi:hypothetical protein